MQNPALHDAAERVQRRAAVGQADHGVVARVALPVQRRVGAVEHVEVSAFAAAPCASTIRRPRLPYCDARGVHLHRLQIGEQHVPVLDGRLLLAEEQFRGAQLQRVVAPSRMLRRTTCAICSMNSGGMSTAALEQAR